MHYYTTHPCVSTFCKDNYAALAHVALCVMLSPRLGFAALCEVSQTAVTQLKTCTLSI